MRRTCSMTRESNLSFAKEIPDRLVDKKCTPSLACGSTQEEDTIRKEKECIWQMHRRSVCCLSSGLIIMAAVIHEHGWWEFSVKRTLPFVFYSVSSSCVPSCCHTMSEECTFCQSLCLEILLLHLAFHSDSHNKNIWNFWLFPVHHGSLIG